MFKDDHVSPYVSCTIWLTDAGFLHPGCKLFHHLHHISWNRGTPYTVLWKHWHCTFHSSSVYPFAKQLWMTLWLQADTYLLETKPLFEGCGCCQQSPYVDPSPPAANTLYANINQSGIFSVDCKVTLTVKDIGLSSGSGGSITMSPPIVNIGIVICGTDSGRLKRMFDDLTRFIVRVNGVQRAWNWWRDNV